MTPGDYTLEFAAATTDIDGARRLAETLNGTLYVDEREAWDHLPFRSLVTGVTDDLDPLAAVADVGLYVVCRRLVKPGDPTVIGLFPLVHHPGKSHQEADAHWRDVHAPLALEHHGFMTHYTQLSVVHRVSGLALDGFALCGFASIDDLRERFFTAPASRGVIEADIQRFADTRNSPRRLIVTQTRFAAHQ
jgi:hypothetical protein